MLIEKRTFWPMPDQHGAATCPLIVPTPDLYLTSVSFRDVEFSGIYDEIARTFYHVSREFAVLLKTFDKLYAKRRCRKDK